MPAADAVSPEPATHFAITPHNNGIVLFCESQNGMRGYHSTDGVRWKRMDWAESDGKGLLPLCADSAPKAGSGLFCLTGDGRIIPTGTTEDHLNLATPFQPIAEAGPWYGAMPEAADTTLFWSKREGCYRAFFCGRRSRGKDKGRLACIGSATSPDMTKWTVEPPLFAPNRFPRMMAPHLIHDTGQTALCYATPEPNDQSALRFAVAPHPEGPYEAPESDIIANDCRCMVQTVPGAQGLLAFFGKRTPTRPQVMSVSRPARVAWRPNGSPSFHFHTPLLQLMGRTIMETEATLESQEVLARIIPRHGSDFRLATRIQSRGADAMALLVRTSLTGSDNIAVWIDFHGDCIEIRRGVRGRIIAKAACALMPFTDYRITLWAEGPFVDLYVNDEWLLSAPTEALLSGGLGLAIKGGEGHFQDLSAQQIAG
jgi:hypothetical protein